MGKDTNTKAHTNTDTAMTTGEKAAAFPDAHAFLALVKKAEKGDAKALAEVRTFCKREPKLWDVLGFKLAQTTRYDLLELLAGGNPIALHAMHHDLGKMERELLGAFPSPLERLLVERICMCYVQVQYAELAYAQKTKGGVTLTHGDYLQRQIDRAHGRYTAAIRALAQVRRLLAPVVQVNIGQKQVNIAGPGANVLNAGGGAAAPLEGDVIEMPHRGQDGA